MRNRSNHPGFGRGGKKPAQPGKGIRPAVFYGLFTVLVGLNVVSAVGLLMSPEIGRLLSGQNEHVLAAYENRIAQLRVEVDRLHSRQYAQAGDINLQLQELAQQQEVLTEQHQYVKALAEKASELGLEAVAVAPTPQPPPGLRTGAVPEALTAADKLAFAGATVERMMGESRAALAAISEAATLSTDEIVAELGNLGIRPRLPAGSDAGVGGPFHAAEPGADFAISADDANAVFEALARFKAARSAIDLAPIHTPLSGNPRISSGYGNRKDPFTGRSAFHAGIDFPDATGTTVLSAGSGIVTHVGPMSGYGNLVEIDHGGGIVTRYGHLSAFLVKEGQKVRTGTPIAEIGSTGRSTGPHLHFEVRRDEKPIDPRKFLAAGRALKRFFVAG